MIPKIIHYCWLSDDPIPSKIQECMNTWSKLEGFTFMKWDKKMFDINSTVYTKDAYDKKLYAFASDYIRIYALYHYGGIYLDTDVKILKNFDNKLLNRPYLLSAFNKNFICGTTLGCEKHNPIFKQILDFYDEHYANKPIDVKTQEIIELILPKALNGQDLNLLSIDYFVPNKNSSNRYEITSNTYCIHIQVSSWKTCFTNLLEIKKNINNKKK